MSLYKITRSIGIDAGHRVPTHGSKCANLHGHRYTIEAVCEATNTLQQEGVQKDMVLDFGFLKDIMMQQIDRLCDHGFILHVEDPWAHKLLHYEDNIERRKMWNEFLSKLRPLAPSVTDYYFQHGNRGNPSKVLVVPFIPTAEKLAEFWYYLMRKDVQTQSEGHADLHSVIVHETPNCYATFGPTTD